MKLVEKPLNFSPHACLVTGRDDGEIVDLEVDFTGIDPHLYLKREIVEEAGELLGMVPRRMVVTLVDRLAVLEEEIAELRPQLEALQTVKAVIERNTNGTDNP